MLVNLILGVAMVAQVDPVRYTVHRAERLPVVAAGWDDPAWLAAETLTVARFHSCGSEHKPLTQARVLHDGRALAVIFRVEDRYVVARNTKYQSPTHKDSCVEFFVQPRAHRGYFNFEFNAIGTLLLWYIEKPRGPDGIFGKYTEVPQDAASSIQISTSLTQPVLAEIADPLVWTVSYRIPLTLFENYIGPLDALSGQTWRANFYKCADDSSHPHWGYWADIGNRLDFHQPDRFAALAFE